MLNISRVKQFGDVGGDGGGGGGGSIKHCPIHSLLSLMGMNERIYATTFMGVPTLPIFLCICIDGQSSHDDDDVHTHTLSHTLSLTHKRRVY